MVALSRLGRVLIGEPSTHPVFDSTEQVSTLIALQWEYTAIDDADVVMAVEIA
jgi:hypothetical protein